MEKLHKLIQTLQASPATSRTVMMDDVKIPGQTFCPVRFSKFIINPIETGNQLRSVFLFKRNRQGTDNRGDFIYQTG